MSKSKSQQIDPHVIPDDDGYTLTRYIRGEERQYGALRFTYRPVSAIKRATFRDGRKDSESDVDGLRRVALAISKRVIKWDAVDLKGNPLPLNQNGVLSLHPSLLVRLANVVVYSVEGGDADPDGSDSSSQDADATDPFGEPLTDDDLLEGARKNS